MAHRPSHCKTAWSTYSARSRPESRDTRNMTAGGGEAQHEVLHTVFHTSEMGLIVLDAAGKIRLWNDWMATTSQVSSAMAQGCTIDAVFPELAGSRVCHAIQEALQHRRASLLSQTLHQAPFPLYRTAAQSRQRVQQLIIIKPLTHVKLVYY